MRLLSHVNDDSDLIEAWLRYYEGLGITSFHLIVHGNAEENATLCESAASHPIEILETYQGEFTSEEKGRRLNQCLERFRGEWLLIVDSDEFVELPYSDLPRTIQAMKLLNQTALPAPFVQRMTVDGSLETPAVVRDPFAAFPLCSMTLYEEMGVTASTRKYPLFFCGHRTVVHSGHHTDPHGSKKKKRRIRGVTHHFKWRSMVVRRLQSRIRSCHTWRHHSLGFWNYLEQHSFRLPVEHAFFYSRKALFDRRLLRRPRWYTLASLLAWRSCVSCLCTLRPR